MRQRKPIYVISILVWKLLFQRNCDYSQNDSLKLLVTWIKSLNLTKQKS